ncbi:hypothetical protein FHS01_005780 [Longimicrobium terrae]|uniref:Uncharacterized protein n=1 Tax=Longimicrobium terrae TaxID=1639882 RepID=A0A841H7X9_9BACT|nr:hypothetical protein [Longimicrobium terrae]MBB4639702.1 hypothetical protein [Longimicrobium terrae]MBB6074098.1 hypothetical protein [Longimicrobium terrae]
MKTLPARAAGNGAPLPLHALTYPEHGPMGWLIIALFCAVGTASALSAPAAAITYHYSEWIAFAIFGIGYGVLAFWIAYEFYRFACWAWWFVFFWLVPPLFPVLFLPWIIRESVAESIVIICIAAAAAGPAH